MQNVNNNISLTSQSYNKLFNEVQELREQLYRNMTSLAGNSTPATMVDNVPTRHATDYRLLPTLDHSVNTFNGRESAYEDEIWFGTVRGLAELNLWPFNLLYSVCTSI